MALPEGNRYFIVDGKEVTVPVSGADALLKQYPKAEEYALFNIGKSEPGVIPLNQMGNFLQKFPTAKPFNDSDAPYYLGIAQKHLNETLSKIQNPLQGVAAPKEDKFPYTPSGGMYTPQGSANILPQTKEDANSIVQGLKSGTKEVIAAPAQAADYLLGLVPPVWGGKALETAKEKTAALAETSTATPERKRELMNVIGAPNTVLGEWANNLHISAQEDIQQASSPMVAQASALLPQMIPIAAAMSVPGLQGAVLPSFAAIGGGSAQLSYRDYLAQKQDKSAYDPAVDAGLLIFGGLVEAGSEGLGSFARFVKNKYLLGAASKVAADRLLAEGGEDAARQIFFKFAKEKPDLAAKVLKLVKNPVEEGGEEVAASVGQYLYENTLYKDEWDYKGLIKDAIQSFGGGFVMGSLLNTYGDALMNLRINQMRKENGKMYYGTDKTGQAFEILAPTQDGYMVLKPDGESVEVPKQSVEKIAVFSVDEVKKLKDEYKAGIESTKKPDPVQEALPQIEAGIAPTVHEDGLIHPVKVKGNEEKIVYVVKGDEKGDPNSPIIIYDPETGQPEMKSADFVIPSEGEYKTPEQAINEQAGMVRLATSEVPKFVTAEDQKYAVIDGSNPVNGITIAPVIANRKGEEEIDQSAAQLITPEMYPQFLEFDAENNGWLQPEQLQSDSPNGAEITPLAETKSSYPLDKNGQPDIDKMDEVQLFNYNKETFGEETAIEDAKGDLKLISDKILKAQKKLETADTKTKIKTRLEISALNERKAKLEGLLPQVTSEAPAAPIQSTEPITPQVSDNNLSQISDINATEPTVQESLTVEPVQMPKELNINEQNTQNESAVPKAEVQPERKDAPEGKLEQKEVVGDKGGEVTPKEGTKNSDNNSDNVSKWEQRLAKAQSKLDEVKNDERANNLNFVGGGNLSKSASKYRNSHREKFGRVYDEVTLLKRAVKIAKGEPFTLRDINEAKLSIVPEQPDDWVSTELPLLRAAEIVRESFNGKYKSILNSDILLDYETINKIVWKVSPENKIEQAYVKDNTPPMRGESQHTSGVFSEQPSLTPQNATSNKPINAETPQTANKAELNVQESSDLRNTTKTVDERKSENLQKAPENGTEREKEPWEMTRKEYVQTNLFGLGAQRRGNVVILKAMHRDKVKQALSDGKPVPEAVLADYPELKPSVKPSKTETNGQVQAEGQTKTEKVTPVEPAQSLPSKEKSPVTGLPEPVAPAVNEQVTGEGEAINQAESLKERRRKEKLAKLIGKDGEIRKKAWPTPKVITLAKTFDPTSPYEEALDYFIRGGKINMDALQYLFGGRGNRGERQFDGERKARISYYSPNGNTIDEIAHSLWENSELLNSDGSRMFESTDYRDAVADVILSFNSPTAMAHKWVEIRDAGADNYLKELSEEQRTWIDYNNVADDYYEWLITSGTVASEEEINSLFLGDEKQDNEEQAINETRVPGEDAPEDRGGSRENGQTGGTGSQRSNGSDETGDELTPKQQSLAPEKEGTAQVVQSKPRFAGEAVSNATDNLIKKATDKFGWTFTKTGDGKYELSNKNGKPVVDVTIKNGKYTLSDRGGKKLTDGNKNVGDAIEKLIAEYLLPNKPLYSIIGERGAQGIDGLVSNLNVAKQMTEAGKDAKTIFLATGWEKFPDGWKYDLPDQLKIKPRFKDILTNSKLSSDTPVSVDLVHYRKKGEVYDVSARLKGAKSVDDFLNLTDATEGEILNYFGYDIANEIRSGNGETSPWWDFLDNEEYEGKELSGNYWVKVNNGAYLKDVLENDNLFSAYPDLKNAIVAFSPDIESYGQFTQTDKGEPVILLKSFGRGVGKFQQSVLLHEIQHAIQDIEGFAKGGNTARERQKLLGKYSSLMLRANKIRGLFEKAKTTQEYKTYVEVSEDYLENKATEEEFNAALKARNETDIYKQYSSEDDKFKLETGYHAFEFSKFFPNSSYFVTDYKAIENYRNQAGEVEARNVQSRLNLTDQQRKQQLLSETQDVAEDQKIYLRDAINNAYSISSPAEAHTTLLSHKDAIDAAKTLDERHNAIQAFVDEMKGVGFDTPVILCKTRQNVIEEYAKTNPTKENLERAKYTFSKPGIITEAFRTNGAIFICSENIIDSNRAFLSFFHETNHEGLRRSDENPFDIYNEFGDEFIKSVVPNQYHDDGEYTLGYEFPSALTEIAFQNSEILSKFVAGEDVTIFVSNYFRTLNAGEYSYRLAELAIKPLNTARNGKNDTSINPLPGRDGVFSKSNPRSVQGTDGFGKDGQETLGSLGRNDKEVNGQYSISKLSGRSSYSDQNDAGELSKTTKDTEGISPSGVPSTTQDAGRTVGKTRRFAGDAIIPDRITVDGVERPTRNSNGKYIYPTKQGIENFWKWFGGSRVVDEQGRPLMVYHGTLKDFNSFDISKTGQNSDSGMWGSGFYFSSSPQYAETYAKRNNKTGSIIPVYLAINDPLVINNSDEIPTIKVPNQTVEDLENGATNYSKKFRDFLINNNHDGVIAYSDEYVALEPTQIKSATGNNGEFSPEEESILLSKQLWHGSPHSFDKFDLSHALSGEGAMAFGYGSYFTNKEGIARDYANKLVPEWSRENKTINDIAADELKQANNNVEEAINNLTDTLKESWSDKKRVKLAIQVLKTGKPLKLADKNLYHVTIHSGKSPSEYDYLRWDKPVTDKQKEVFKNILEDIVNSEQDYHKASELSRLKVLENPHRKGEYMDGSGSDAYMWLTDLLGTEKAASERLLKFGIDGIEYPAIGGTGGREGDAMNYVVFDDNAITIDEHIQFSKRNVSETGFYSTVENALDNIKQEKGTKEQFKVMLLNNGAKQAEMDWMGFEDHFAGISKMVTKSDIQKWIDENRIEVREVVKGENDKVALIEKELLNYGIRTVNYPDGSNFINEDGDVVRSQDVSSEIRDIMYSYRAAKDDENYKTKYYQYQLPGGSNYKELLLTMPGKEYFKNKTVNIKVNDEWLDARGAKNKLGIDDISQLMTGDKINGYYISGTKQKNEPTDANFKSSHFDEPNIVAHVRFNERTDTDGGRVLFVEEIQSDWAQKGKKEGFKDSEETKKEKLLYDLGGDWHAVTKGYGVWANATIEQKQKELNRIKTRLEINGLTEDDFAESLTKWGDRTQMPSYGLPNMPFKKTDQWVNLALRRMVRYAAENGFDRIAWTSGEQQAERYDLSEQVNEINYRKNNDETYQYSVQNNTEEIIGSKSATIQEIENTVGKEIAQKIQAGDGNEFDFQGSKFKSLSGLDLKVGGEGMKAFYDQIIPNAAAKLGKPFGAKVEEIATGDKDKMAEWRGATIDDVKQNAQYDSPNKIFIAKSLPITPEMRQSALEGMPLFSRKIIDGTPQNFSGFALPPKPPKPPKPPTFAGDYLNSPEFSKRSKAIKKSTVQAKRDMSAMGEKLVTGFDKFLSYAADQDLALKNFQEGVKKLGGTVTKDNDAYQIITTLSSRNAREAYHFNKDYFEPLETAVVNLTRDGSEAWEVTRYMKAKRSLEREDNEGLQSLNPDPNHPWSRQNVEKYVQDFESKHPLRLIFELWDANKKAQTRIIDIAEESGKINSRYADNMRNRAKYYVPLRGWTYANPETQDPTEIFEYEHEAPNYQELQMTAEGRGSEAGDPLAYTRMLAISAIHSANRNKLKQRVANVLRENKDIPGIEKFGYFKNTYEELMDDGTWVEKEGIPTVAKMMKGTVRLFPEDTGNKKRITQQQAGENELAVYEKGRKIVMIFQDPEMKRVLTGRNQIGQEFLDSKFVQKYMANPVQYWKQLTTQWNPNFFLIKNPVRDLMGAVPSYWVTGGSMIEYNKDVLLADKHLARVFFDKGTGTSLDKLTQLWFDRGGLTMYATMDDVHKTARSIKKELSKLNNKIAFEDLIAGKADNLADIIGGTRNAAGRAVKKWLDFASMWGENRTRLGIFLAEVAKNTKYDASKGSIWDQAIAELNSGRNIDSEILVSKEMSGNFNRKGRVSGLFGKFYPFWNPPLQSAYKHFNMAKANPKRFGLMMAGIASMGFLWQMLLNALMGDDEYNKLKWRKYATITFPVGDYNISLPMGFVWNLPWSIGAGAYNVAKGFLEPKRYAMETASNLIQTATPFSTKVTDYGSMDMVRPFVPWALTLPYDIATNSDWSGKTIYNESPFNPNKPDSWLGKKNVNPILDKTFKGLNEATGGNEFKKGVVDWNPSKVEHTIQFIFSGLGKFGTQVANLSVDKDLSVNEIPIIYSFVSKGSEQSNYIEYKILKDKIEKYHSEIHNYEKNNMTKELNKYRDVRMDELYDYYSDINKDLKEMWDNESDAKQREEKMQILIDKAKELKVK